MRNLLNKNDNYYIGEWLNDQRHGKGTLYYSIWKIKYEVDFIKDKFEGNGKIFLWKWWILFVHFLNG